MLARSKLFAIMSATWYADAYHSNDDAPVAQLDRAIGYEPIGQEFESLRVRHLNRHWCQAYQHSAPVAQLDRVIGYEPIGQEFESLRVRHFSNKIIDTVLWKRKAKSSVFCRLWNLRFSSLRNYSNKFKTNPPSFRYNLKPKGPKGFGWL